MVESLLLSSLCLYRKDLWKQIGNGFSETHENSVYCVHETIECHLFESWQNETQLNTPIQLILKIILTCFMLVIVEN